MLLNEVVEASADVAAVSGRKAKIARLAELLTGAGWEDVPLVAGFLTGELRQGKVGVGFAAIRDLDAPPASEPSLTVADVEAMADDLTAEADSGAVADGMVTFTVTKISGRVGGIAGLRDIEVEISAQVDGAAPDMTTLAIGEEGGETPFKPGATTVTKGESG